MIIYYKKDFNYSIQIDNEGWYRVFYENMQIAIVISYSSARQVVYRDIIQNGGNCEYLNENDFREKKK